MSLPWKVLEEGVSDTSHLEYSIKAIDETIYWLQIQGHVPYLFMYPPVDVFKDPHPDWTMEAILDKFTPEFNHFGAFTVFFPPDSSIYTDSFAPPLLAPVYEDSGRITLVRSDDPLDQVLTDPYDNKSRETAGRYSLKIVRPSNEQDQIHPFLIISELEEADGLLTSARSIPKAVACQSHRPIAPPVDSSLAHPEAALARIRLEMERTNYMANLLTAQEEQWRLSRRTKLQHDEGDVIQQLKMYTHDLPGSFFHKDDSWDGTPAWSTRRAASTLVDVGGLAWTHGEGSSYIYQSRQGISVFGLHNEDLGTASVNSSRGFSKPRLKDSGEWSTALFKDQPFKGWSVYGQSLIDGYPDMRWEQAAAFSRAISWLQESEKVCGQRHRHATIYCLGDDADTSRLLNIQPAGATTFTLLGALHQGINYGATINEAIAIAPRQYKEIVRPILAGESSERADAYIANTTCFCSDSGIGKNVLQPGYEANQEFRNTRSVHKERFRAYNKQQKDQKNIAKRKAPASVNARKRIRVEDSPMSAETAIDPAVLADEITPPRFPRKQSARHTTPPRATTSLLQTTSDDDSDVPLAHRHNIVLATSTAYSTPPTSPEQPAIEHLACSKNAFDLFASM